MGGEGTLTRIRGRTGATGKFADSTLNHKYLAYLPLPTPLMMDLTLHTPRLRLRELVFDDAEFILGLLNSPGWLTYIGDRQVRTAEAAKAYLEQGPIRSYRENGFGLMIAVRQSDGKPVGVCGLLRRSDLPCPDLGFALLPEFAGMGYGTEMARAMLQDGRTRLGYQTIFAITMPENHRSIRLLGKIGFKFLEHFSFADNPEVLLLYEYRHPVI